MSIGLVDDPERRISGFTLMELLVALTLLSLLMTVLFGGLRFGTRVWDVTNHHLERNSSVLTLRGFLRQRLEEATPVVTIAEDLGTKDTFIGEQEVLQFASSMPISLGQGIFLIELSLRQGQGDDQNKDLIVRWRPWPNSSNDEVGDRTILKDLAGIKFAYFGMSETETNPMWYDEWNREKLPELIRVDIQFPTGDHRKWSPLIISPMVDQWYNPGYW